MQTLENMIAAYKEGAEMREKSFERPDLEFNPECISYYLARGRRLRSEAFSRSVLIAVQFIGKLLKMRGR